MLCCLCARLYHHHNALHSTSQPSGAPAVVPQQCVRGPLTVSPVSRMLVASIALARSLQHGLRPHSLRCFAVTRPFVRCTWRCCDSVAVRSAAQCATHCRMLLAVLCAVRKQYSAYCICIPQRLLAAAPHTAAVCGVPAVLPGLSPLVRSQAALRVHPHT